MGDYATRISINASALPKIVCMTTVTAPGTEALRAWGERLAEDLEHDPLDADEVEVSERAHLRRILHQDGTAAAWNATAARRLSRLHRAASAQTRRKHGQVAKIAVNVWENQDRDLLHAHRVLDGPHAVCQTYAEALSERAEQYGFGFVDRGTKRRENGWARQLKAMTGARAARYVGKYVQKNMRGSHGPKTVAKVQEHMRGGRRRAGGNVVYLGKMLTTKTGCTARWLRWKRVAYVFGADPFTGEEVRVSEVRAEVLAAGHALPRPPPADELARAAAWSESHPLPTI